MFGFLISEGFRSPRPPKEFRNLPSRKKGSGVPRDTLRITIRKTSMGYSLNFNCGGLVVIGTDHLVLEPDAPSKLSGYKGWTAEEAYLHRKEYDKPEPGAAFGWIPLRESERITTPEQVEKAIALFVERQKSEGEVWEKIERVYE